MKAADANAIAHFMEQGGQVLKGKAAISATEQEVLVYLASCGVTVKYFPGDLKPYAYNRRRYSIDGLLRLANEHRRAQRLSPLMVL